MSATMADDTPQPTPEHSPATPPDDTGTDDGFGLDLSSHWMLDPQIDFLNHGSFGACPKRVLHHQQELRERMERNPVHFFARELQARLDRARAEVAEFVGASPAGLAFMPNATSGVNAVLRSLDFSPGDELLVPDQAYPACRNALDFVAERTGARTVVAELPFPLSSPDEVVEAIVSKVTDRTRLALIDHVTSATGLVLPIAQIVEALAERGVGTLVDGAHAPGMLPLDIEALGCTYYAANCHKWLCAPKGSAFLWVAEARREAVRPLAISHGATWTGGERSRYHVEFDWPGTHDFTPYLCVPEAIRFLRSLVPDGWAGIYERNRRLALLARDKLCTTLAIAPPAPAEMIATLVAVPLPDAQGPAPASIFEGVEIQKKLWHGAHIEVPVFVWPSWPHRLLRTSSQLYNSPAQYDRLCQALATLLAGGELVWEGDDLPVYGYSLDD